MQVPIGLERLLELRKRLQQLEEEKVRDDNYSHPLPRRLCEETFPFTSETAF